MLGYTKILCALDFDEHLTATFLIAAALAKESNAMLYLLHVTKVPAPDADVPLPFDADPRWERDARLRLEDLVRQHAQGELHSEIRVRSGWPNVDIAREAAQLGVDLIVVGTHGRSGVSHLLLGSVAEHVIREATCPVLVIRPVQHDPKHGVRST